MIFTKVTSSDVGAPTLSSPTVNGQICTLLDYVLVTIGGWSIEYTGTNRRVYRPPFGNRLRFWVCHDSAVSGSASAATVRGCENASAATSSATLTNPFPTTAQLADNICLWRVGTTSNSTVMNYIAYVSSTCFYLFIQPTAIGQITTTGWYFFGDVVSSGYWGPDSWNTVCKVDPYNSTSIQDFNWYNSMGSLTSISPSNYFWARDIAGTVLSSRGRVSGIGTGFGRTDGYGALRGQYGNKMRRMRTAVADCATTALNTSGSAALEKRAYLPHLWDMLGNSYEISTTSTREFASTGAFNGTVVTDSNVPTAVLRVIASVAFNDYNCRHGLIFEESNTWTLPTGV